MYIILRDDHETIEQIDTRNLPLSELAHPSVWDRYIEINEPVDYETGDKYIDGQVVKPSYFYFITNTDNDFINFTKEFNEITDDNYHTITKAEYDEYANSGKAYKYINGDIVEYIPPKPRDKYQDQIDALAFNQEFLEDCLIELAQVVYE